MRVQIPNSRNNSYLIISNGLIEAPKMSHISLVGEGGAMRVELLINLIAPGIIIPLGTFGNCLALWTLFFSKLLQKRVVSIFLITIFLADISTNNTIYMARWFVNLARMNLTEYYKDHTITFMEGGNLELIFHGFEFLL